MILFVYVVKLENVVVVQVVAVCHYLDFAFSFLVHTLMMVSKCLFFFHAFASTCYCVLNLFPHPISSPILSFYSPQTCMQAFLRNPTHFHLSLSSTESHPRVWKPHLLLLSIPLQEGTFLLKLHYHCNPM